MVTCPVCGSELRREDLRRSNISCPRCGERLRWPEFGGYLFAAGVVLSPVLAFLMPYVLGARGNNLLLWGIILLLPISAALGGALGLLRGLLFQTRLERHLGTNDGRILHITDPPESPNKS